MIRDARDPIVVMGVSGCGKSTIAARLAEEMGRSFLDADDIHPAANVAKMTAGIPLSDDDRRPWLDAVGERLDDGSGIVVACSALKVRYRDRLRLGAPDTVFVHLTGTPLLLSRRITSRSGHYMPPSLLGSQLEALEPLGPDERGATIDIGDPVPAVVAMARVAVTRLGGRGAVQRG